MYHTATEKGPTHVPDGITIQVIICCKFDNTSRIMLRNINGRFQGGIFHFPGASEKFKSVAGKCLTLSRCCCTFCDCKTFKLEPPVIVQAQRY